MKREIVFLIVVSLFFSSGCRAITSKFVRKKDVKKEPTVYAMPREYPLSDNKELYIDYYVYARGWMKELVSGLQSQTDKKIVASCQSVVENLTGLRAFFEEQPDYQERMDYYIVEFQDILDTFQEHKASVFDLERFVYRVEKLRKDFEKDFKVSRIFG